MTSPTALYDLIRFTTATTGTGTLTVGSAVAPFMTPATYGSPFNSGTTVVWYSIIDVAGGNSETGIGTYTASGTTLSRTPITSTNSNSAISLSGSAQVCFTALASSLVIQGGALGTPSSGTLTNCTLPASALTGTTLASGVTASSLTSVGTLTGLAVNANAVGVSYAGNTYFAVNDTTNSRGITLTTNNGGGYTSLLMTNGSYNWFQLIGYPASGRWTLYNNTVNSVISADYSTGDVSIPSSTASTSTTTGALVVGGGVGIGGALYVSGGASAVLNTSSGVTSGAGSSAGTLLNAPTAGNPTKWIPFNDNGTTRYIPAW